ncbi:pyrroline-5-carboxylate reductase 3 isoform X2 [Neocloeon triangulifer]|uniref:pyrroline-5-carboxylate reductase 3 isoform X2 n=1 Tax=Neocloeon triangulifer TaxID=2078957 RepID=UPI00286F715B|nr:pyrroline-5-carboxylate reductase 3 isoform X2 [Neocloeon triangulifer]
MKTATGPSSPVSSSAFQQGQGVEQRLPAGQVTVSAPSDRNLGKWKDAGAQTVRSNCEVATASEVVILALKPQQFQGQWTERLPANKEVLYISVMAGISTGAIRDNIIGKGVLRGNAAVVRTMPNTPMMAGLGATVICADPYTPREHIEIAKLIFGAGNCLAEEVPETLVDAGGALVGCGPAFVYQFIEALADGAVAQGVPRDMANRLTAQMVLGAAKMVQTTGKHPGLLKDEVCSPAGTTIAGLHALKKGQNFNVAVMDAIEASTARSKQLNK